MRLGLVSVALLIAGCSQGALGPDFHIVVAGNALAPNNCMSAEDSVVTAPRLRLTARVHQNDSARTLVTGGLCDILVDNPAKLPTLAIKTPPDSRMDIFAETFTPSGAGYIRTHSGALYDLDPATKTIPMVRLFAAEAFRCSPGIRLTQSRAFHSATQLPNGQIIFAGGLTASSVPGSNGPTNLDLYATGSIEVFDPATNSMVQLSDVTAPRVRAFHQAILLNSAPPYQLLLVGGVTSGSTEQQVMRVSGITPPGRLSGSGGIIVAAPPELVVYDPSAKTLTRSADPSGGALHSNAFQAGTALPGGGALVAGGWTGCAGVCTGDKHVDLSPNGATVIGSEIAETWSRMGAALVPFSNLSALLLAGLENSAQLPFVRIDLAVTPPLTTPVAADSADPIPLLQLVTASYLGSNRVLIAGGLEHQPGNLAIEPPTIAPLIAKDNGTGNIQVTSAVLDGWSAGCSGEPRYRSAAFNAAILLGDHNRTLLSGGTAHHGSCQNCEIINGVADDSLSCALHQAAIFDGSNDHLTQIAPLQIARWGHTQSLLPGGMVLVAGGMTRVLNDSLAWQTYGASDFELYNAARRAPPMVTSSTGASNDPDDPVLQDLLTLNLSRELGVQAHDSAGLAIISCKQP